MTDFKAGDYVRAKRHDGTRAGGKAAPVYRLREALKFRADEKGVAVPYTDGELERVVVVSHPPYRRGMVLPFNDAVVLGEGLIKTEMPLKKVPAASARSNRSGSRRRA